MIRSVALNILLVIVLSLSGICQANAENPNVSTSFRSNNTVPSEGQRRRLITSPNPISATGNDIITGNVSGLGYFHGVVPYGSTYYNSANLSDQGTAAVSSFLRRSVNPVISDRNPGQRRVYYEPRRTVSTFTRPNIQRSAPSGSITTGHSLKNDFLMELPDVSRTNTQQRPLSSNNDELDRILARQFELKEQAKESNRKLLQKKESNFQNFFEIQLKPNQIEEPTLKEETSKTLLEQEKTREETTVRDIDQPLQQTEIEDVEKIQNDLEMQVPEHFPIQQDIPADQDNEKTTEDGTSDTRTEGIDLEKVRERAAEHAEAVRIRGEHKTFESLSQARFVNYMQAAEEFMQKGEYYKAADTYALAAVWKPDDPRTYMAQSFALFAAGEYMSSAYYLSQAIEMNPASAASKYDLAGLIGDRDVFENRLIEMTTWQQRSGSGELSLVLAYILYHDGQIAKATEAIQQAVEKMPDNPAVAALADVIIPATRTTP